MWAAFLVGCGGFLGSIARYVMGCGVRNFFPSLQFPVATMGANLIGCLLIGIIGGIYAQSGIEKDSTFLFFVVGVLGGFTTFAAFGYELFEFAHRREMGMLLIYACGSILGGMAACGVGWIGAMRLLAR